MERQKINIVIFCLIGLLFALATPHFALSKKTLSDAESSLTDVIGKSGLEESDISSAAGTVVKGILSAIALLFFALMVYAGMVWMLAKGDEARVTKARETIIAATIGLIVIVASYAVTNLVVERVILKNTGVTDDDGSGEILPNMLGEGMLVCCITPIEKGDASNYFVIQQKMSFVNESQCDEIAFNTVYADDYYTEKGKHWDVYPDVIDSETCSEVLDCWYEVGSENEKLCLDEVLQNNYFKKIDDSSVEDPGGIS